MATGEDQEAADIACLSFCWLEEAEPFTPTNSLWEVLDGGQAR